MLLGGVLAVTYMEMQRGVRFGGLRRRAFERKLLRVMHVVRSRFSSVTFFLQRDIFAKTLHMCTYTALVVVRYVERRLAHVTKRIRKTTKSTRSPYVSNLRMVARAQNADEYDTEFREV